MPPLHILEHLQLRLSQRAAASLPPPQPVDSVTVPYFTHSGIARRERHQFRPPQIKPRHFQRRQNPVAPPFCSLAPASANPARSSGFSMRDPSFATCFSRRLAPPSDFLGLRSPAEFNFRSFRKKPCVAMCNIAGLWDCPSASLLARRLVSRVAPGSSARMASPSSAV